MYNRPPPTAPSVLPEKPELGSIKHVVRPRLPAPPMPVTAQTNALPMEGLPSTNLLARLMENPVKLTAEQAESYLKANRRSVASLLAAYHTTGDLALLKEAMQKYPSDPRVAFEAVFNKDASTEERRQWLDAFKQSAPENSLPNYLSALDYFKAGQTDLAVQELEAAGDKAQFEDYRLEAAQNDIEAYLAAGYSVAEAKTLGMGQLELPQLRPLRDLGRDYIVPLASSYRQGGDGASGEAATQMALNLAQRLEVPPGFLINQLVGIAIERVAFSAMDPASPYGGAGQTVQDQINQLTEQRAAIKELGEQFNTVTPTLSEQDWINYRDREMTFGGVAAMQWVVSKYGQK
jgi:hypothetical protein